MSPSPPPVGRPPSRSLPPSQDPPPAPATPPAPSPAGSWSDARREASARPAGARARFQATDRRGSATDRRDRSEGPPTPGRPQTNGAAASPRTKVDRRAEPDSADRRNDAGDPALADNRVSGEIFRPLGRRRASAGRIIGVGLLCFALWTVLDANQLYHSALEGPDGARRTVAVAILRPISAVSNALGLTGLVNWGNSILGRGAGALGQSQNLPTVTAPTVYPFNHQMNGTTPLPHSEIGGYVPPPPTPPPITVPPIPPPTPLHRLTILDIGDSVGEDLGSGLGDIFTGDHYVNIVQKGVEDTGLDRPDYWNWPGHLEQDLQQYHPGAVVIMMGLNDDSNLNQKGNSPTAYCPSFGPPCVVALGTKLWVHDYTARVSLLMNEALLSGAHVLWVGLPPVNGGNVTNAFCKQVNAIDIAQAKLHPGVTYVPSWNVLSNSHGGFALYLRINGTEEQIRSSDGVHILPPGYDLLARSLVGPMQQAWHVNLHVLP